MTGSFSLFFALALEWVLPFAVAALCVLIHQFAIRVVFKRMPSRGFRTRAPNMAKAVLILLGAHIAEITLFAAALYGLDIALDEAQFKGAIGNGFKDYLYFSGTAYSSLGLGDIEPYGPLRLITAVEALTGLIMIAWTAAFLFAETERSE